MKKNLASNLISNASWANKYGVTKQNGNHSSGLGLNPNLNIEDEYIENLLKQIHFMNLEVKLLKEKQQQSEGNGLWGIINRSDEPLVKNIVDSNQKYQAMKKQVDTDLNKTQFQNNSLAEQQTAVIKQLNYLENKINIFLASKQDLHASSKAKQDKIKDKINQFQQKIKNISIEKEQELKKNTEITNQYEAFLLEAQKERFIGNYERQKIRNDEIIEEQIEKEKEEKIRDLKNKINKLKAIIEGNLGYQKALEEQAIIKTNIHRANKTISASEFTLLRVNEAIKLAEREKEKDILERKKLTEEYQSLKTILKEIQELNEKRREAEIVSRRRESADIQKGEYQTKKMDKNLDQIKKKLARSEESQKNIRGEVENYQRELAKLKDKSEGLMKVLQLVSAKNDEEERVLSNLRHELRKFQDQFEKCSSSELNAMHDLNEIEKQIVYLRERKNYLGESLHLKETINEMRLEELQKVVQKNNDVNETVDTLMKTWEEVKRFSKI